ncbi:MAG: RagB/SusD family nutrient uptake outer membrane protein [Bacteroidales bacterium]
MKKATYFVIRAVPIFLGIMLLGSCDKNLDIKPTQELESIFYQDEARVQRSVGSAYAGLANIYGAKLRWASCITPMLLPGDDIIADGTGNPFFTFSGLNSTNGSIEEYWKRLYIIIGRCNFVLDKLEEPEVQAVYETPGLMEANRGEMLFLRSWCYFRLWDWWRKAPIQKERISTLEDAYLPPTEGFEMLDNAIASLEEAAGLLPDSWDTENLGRVTKNSAYGLLVRLHVLRACYNNASNDDYQNAIDAFNNISGSAQLVHFGENFDYRYENNAESLFEYQASHAPFRDNPWLDNDFGGDVGQMGAFWHMFTNHWTNYHSGSMGPSPKLRKAFEPGDPRQSETFRDTANLDDLGGSLGWVVKWDKYEGHAFVKYVNGERGNAFDPTWNITNLNNPRLLRLADVKLLAAEAYLATGNAGEALTQVNDIRKRARESTPDETVSPVPADLASVTMDDIMHERLLELAGEDGIRWTDLRRWHAAGYIDLGSWTTEDFGFPYDPALFEYEVPKHLLYPIPNSEIDRNPLMLEAGNNPGY